MKASTTTAALLLVAGALALPAQIVKHPPQRSAAELEQEVAALIRKLSDFGGLTEYGSENAEIKLDPKVDRVVFLGDEITRSWGTGATPFFPGKPYFNRGIDGQTTQQMLVRFRQDVVALKPKAVIIQAGSNDFAGNTGPATQGTVEEFFMTMSDLARAHGIKVIFASVTPVCDCVKNLTAWRTPGRILGMNGWLKDYAKRTGAVYLDYYSVLAQGRAMKRELTVDGLVPNDAGYTLMAPLAEKAIAEALASK